MIKDLIPAFGPSCDTSWEPEVESKSFIFELTSWMLI